MKTLYQSLRSFASLRLCVGLILLLGSGVCNFAQAQEPAKVSPVHLVNLYGKAGYVAMFDNLNRLNSNTLAPDNVFSKAQTIGGGGAGLGAAYELELGAFRLNAGLEFEFLNSASRYAFMVNRPVTKPYEMTYQYWAYDHKETRNLGYANLPITVGAQFNRYFFMVGAKVGYGFPFSYKICSYYDIVGVDNQLLDPVIIGSEVSNFTNHQDFPLVLKQPNVAAIAEFGIDLDEWLQAQPDKRKKRVKPGERIPFGKEHIHYKASVFAEYAFLNGNATTGYKPMDFADNSALLPTATPTVLGFGDTKLNNLFVGVKFAVQFEIPGKTPRPTPPPPSYANVQVLDEETAQPIEGAILSFTNTKNGKVALKPKQLKKGVITQKVGIGQYEATATATNYYPATQTFEIAEAGITEDLTLSLKAKPVLRLTVVDDETNAKIATSVKILKRETNELLFDLQTDSVEGMAKTIAEDTVLYNIHVEQIGYEAYDIAVANPRQALEIRLRPIKKGEVFTLQNMFFATNETRILRSSEQTLSELADYLLRNAEIRIRIIGHTDNVGSEAANQKLSDGRANAVRDDLIRRGVAAERVEAEGRGESQPIDTNDTEEGRQNNRRVEIEIL